MHKNIFLASYPKSGNTWLRSIIGNFYNFEKEFSLNDLKSIPLLSIKKHFNEFQNKVYINNNELHFDWISQNIIKCQNLLNNKTNHLNIFKTHSARHKNFTNETVNAGFIYIVRDPRDIVVSFKNFTGNSFDKVIDELLFHIIDNADLKKKNWFNIGGKAKVFFKANELKDLVEFLKILNKREKIHILGAGSNTLVTDELYNGVIIKV